MKCFFIRLFHRSREQNILRLIFHIITGMREKDAKNKKQLTTHYLKEHCCITKYFLH